MDKRVDTEKPALTTTTDIIIGIHSIREALKNPERRGAKITATEKGLKELKESEGFDQRLLEKVEIKKVDAHQLQQEAQKMYAQQGLTFSRIPSQIFLQVPSLPIYDPSWLVQLIESHKKRKKPLKIFCLEQVTDVHNGAAVLRTAAFYGVDVLILSLKGSLGLTPSFFRIASGAAEYVRIVRAGHLPKLLKTLTTKGVECIGFAEEGQFEEPVSVVREEEEEKFRALCLVMGSEDKGLSFAVKRVLEKMVALKGQGPMTTLNVSVAAGIGMERYF